MRTLAIIICSGICFFAGAQNFVKGYIINLRGDTVKGEVKINPNQEEDAYSKFFFKDEKGVQKNYKPEKIKGYGFDNRNFRSIEFGGEKGFYEVLAKGHLTFFKTMYEAMRMNESAIEAEYYVIPADTKKMTYVKVGKFKKQMTELMKDNPEFINAYVDEKKFDLEKALVVINQYNSWKAGKK